MLIQENAELRQALHQMTEKYNKFLQGKQGVGGWAAVISGVDGFCCCCCCRHFCRLFCSGRPQPPGGHAKASDAPPVVLHI